jgi:hypothetical protein
VEIDFGNNLYGKRKTGFTNVAANTATSIDFAANVTKLVSYGGEWDDGGGTALNVEMSNENGIFSYIRHNTVLYFTSRTSRTRENNNAPYDIWVTYKK